MMSYKTLSPGCQLRCNLSKIAGITPSLGAALPTSDNPNDPLLNLQAPINIGDPSESNVLLAQVGDLHRS